MPHDRLSPPSSISRVLPPLSLAVFAGCTSAIAMPAPLPVPAPAPASAIAAPAELLRARGPAGLADLLAQYDRMQPGPERDRLALTIDRVAGQRYATVSRLYWHTDLDTAKAAAAATDRPILALRMLGRLDEDLSCANSRLFRTTLYANGEVSRFLRDNFVLYWSSERPVPRVTIDFGDGRTLEGTTTGNSAHYVLDETGAVLDVLPGVYAPIAFRTELARSLELAEVVDELAGDARRQAITTHHARARDELDRRWAALANTPYLPDLRALARPGDVQSALARGQRATVTKAIIEVPQLKVITAGVDPGDIADSEIALWATAGQAMWKIEDVLDPASRALVERLHNAGPARATPAELAAMLARLEQHLVADSAQNELKLRRQLHQHLVDHDDALDSVNAWVYANVFHTPRADAWLGLLPRTDFTGLPGDGVVMAKR